MGNKNKPTTADKLNLLPESDEDHLIRMKKAGAIISGMPKTKKTQNTKPIGATFDTETNILTLGEMEIDMSKFATQDEINAILAK